MSRPDLIEFYDNDSGALIASVESSVRLDVADLISIRKTTYEVVSWTLALDHSDDAALRRMRTNVNLWKLPDDHPDRETD